MKREPEKVLKPGLGVPLAVVALSWLLPSLALGAARKTKVGRIATHPTTASLLGAARTFRRPR